MHTEHVTFSSVTMDELQRIATARHMTVEQLVVEIVEAALFGPLVPNR